MAVDPSGPVGVLVATVGVLAALAAVGGYLRGHDPVHRRLALLFLPDALLLAAGAAPAVDVPAVLPVLVLARGWLTLWLAAALGPVSRRGLWGAAAATVAAASPVTTAGVPYSAALAVVGGGVLVVVQGAAVLVLVRAARGRLSGLAARLRLAAVSGAAWLVAVVLAAAAAWLGAGAAGRSPVRHEGSLLLTVGFGVVAVASAAGYLLAFLPPYPLRRGWATVAAEQVGRQIQTTAASEPGPRIWQRYVDAVQHAVGADAVALVVPQPDGAVRVLGAVGVPPVDWGAADLAVVLAMRQPALLPAAGRCALLASYGRHFAGRRLVAVPLPPRLASGALLVVPGRGSLLHPDDVRLVAGLAGAAGVLAERSELLVERQVALVEQRRLATVLQESVTALTAANNAKREFLATMSHELRTPLNAIIGFSDLARSELDPDDPHAAWAGHILDAGNHLLALINDLLDVSRLESGRLDLVRRAVRLDEAVQERLVELAPLLAEGSLGAEVQIPAITVAVDPLRFGQIMENLLVNAVKFTPPGGWITVAAATGPLATVSVTVTDTGPGVAEVDLDRIFDPFDQAGDPFDQAGAATSRARGTGLGLAIARRFAQAHGGQLTVRSSPPAGSTFTVTLPGALLVDVGGSANGAGGSGRLRHRR